MSASSSLYRAGSAPRGMTRLEWAASAALVLLLGAVMAFGASYARRISRDARQVSEVRQVQAMLEAYRLERLGYPTAADAPAGFSYRPTPEGCAPATASPCLDYELTFFLEGALGGLAGGNCTATRENISCAKTP